MRAATELPVLSAGEHRTAKTRNEEGHKGTVALLQNLQAKFRTIVQHKSFFGGGST